MRPKLIACIIFATILPRANLQGLTVVDTNGFFTLNVNGQSWLMETEELSDVVMHKDNTEFSRQGGSLVPYNSAPISGSDLLGSYSGTRYDWAPLDTYFSTSYRVYDSNRVAVFKQAFSNMPEDLQGTDVAHLLQLDRAVNEISTIFPSFVTNIAQYNLGFWSFGGRMAGTPCISIGSLEPDTDTIRDGSYGGPVILFNERGSDVIILSPLNNFMVSNIKHRPNPNPFQDLNNAGKLEFGLQGSIRSITGPDFELEYVVAYGTNFNEAFQTWGDALKTYNGKTIDGNKENLIADYIGYWTDNGAFYYYHTMEGKDYEETIIDIRNYFLSNSIPAQYLEIDSWWYPKDEIFAVLEWTALLDIFPNGLQYLQSQINWPIAAHNRYWSRNNVYDIDNGGNFTFLKEAISIPQEEAFWNYLFSEGKQWGLVMYNQDWQDFQYELMRETVTDLHVSRNWLRQMNNGAMNNDIEIQYCMTLPRELMESSELDAVTRVRVSEDYLISEDQWRIGLTSHVAGALSVKPFKDVFWTNTNNPGNNYYYNCMEVNLPDDPNSPWPINYRYVGPINFTASGRPCLNWYDLNLHWKYPLGDLTRNGCRNPQGMVENDGMPFCFYQADLYQPMDTWLWEFCDLPICEQNCTRMLANANATMPYCEELVEPNPDLQAVVSTLSTAGVGFGDKLEFIDSNVLMRACREDGKILTVDRPVTAAPIQVLEMAFGGGHAVKNPVASEVGEIWSSSVTIGGHHFGVVLSGENHITKNVSLADLGLEQLSASSRDYLKFGFYDQTHFMANSSDLFPLTLQDYQQFDLMYFSPLFVASDGRRIALKGDRAKYVPFAGQRFLDISFENDVLTFTTEGGVQATVSYTSEGQQDQEFTDEIIACSGSLDENVTYQYDMKLNGYSCA